MKNQAVELLKKQTIGFNDTEVIISTKQYTDFSELEAKSREEKSEKIDYHNFEKITVIPFEKITEINYPEYTQDVEIVYTIQTEGQEQTKTQSINFVKIEEKSEFISHIVQLKNFDKSGVKQTSESFFFYVGGILLSVILVVGSVYLHLNESNGVRAGKTHIIVELFQKLVVLAGIPITLGVGAVVTLVFIYLAYEETKNAVEKIVYK